MSWFRKSFRFGKKKSSKRAKKISEPSSFRHCYHATFDDTRGEFLGLPPQWVGLVSPRERPPKSTSSSPHSRVSSAAVTVMDGVQLPIETRSTANSSTVEPTANILTVGSQDSQRGSKAAGAASEGDKTPRTDGSASPVSVATRESAGNRPVPIIRGSDCCLEETVKYIRKHYRSSSSASPYDEETADEQYVDIHFGSRSRSGSLMQLRGQGNASAGASRANIVSYTSSSTSTVNNSNSNDPLSSNSAFCLSAPHDLNVVRSDLGLYDCDTSSTSNTTLFRSRIHSPSESSGYFGSTMSSLCSSRVSALSSVPQIHASPGASNVAAPSIQQTPTPAVPQYRYSTLHETTEAPWLHPQMRPGQPHFSSLQRPGKYYREGGSHATARAYAQAGPNIAAYTNSPPGHYGTTPRAYAHRPRGESVDNGLMYRYYRERGVQPESRSQQHLTHKLSPVSYTSNATLIESHSAHSTRPHYMPAQPAGTSTSPHSTQQQQLQQQPPSKPKRHHRTMTSEQFRATLELLVNKSDPRKDLCELAKLGEGSTGVVHLARQNSTGQKVAVKKMNLWRQQRRELLFNEVRTLTRTSSNRVHQVHYEM